MFYRILLFMQCPLKSHWLACKRILRYLHGISGYGLYFMAQGKLELTSYIDVDWASNAYDRTSIRGYCIYLRNNLISWSSKKQNAAARSSTESKYRALAKTTAEMLWLVSILQELNILVTNTPAVLRDNTSTASLATN